MRKNFNRLLVVCLFCILLGGCGREKEPLPEAIIPPQPQNVEIESVEYHVDIDPDIMESFDLVKEFIYKFGKVVSQEKIAFDAGDGFRPALIPPYIETYIVMETDDSIKTVYNYYKQYMPETSFELKSSDGELYGIQGVHLKKIDKKPPVEVHIKVSNPSRHFSKGVRSSQSKVIKQQIQQYERIKQMQLIKQKQAPESEAIKKAIEHCDEQIKKLHVQLTNLSSETTLIDISMRYLIGEKSAKTPSEETEEKDNQ